MADRSHKNGSFADLRRRVRRQLLWAYLAPLALLAGLFSYQHGATLREGIEGHLKAIAENKRNTVSLFLQERIANLKNAFRFSGLPALPRAEEMERVLAGLRRENGAFVDLGLFDEGGTLRAYAGPFPGLLGRGHGDDRWFRRLRQQPDGITISDLILGHRGRAHFVIAVSRYMGGQAWVLRASVDPERFASFVEKSHHLPDTEAFIVNRRGVRQAPAAGRPFSPMPEPSVDTPVVETEQEGRAHLAAIAWLAEADWALVVQVPAAIALAPVRRARLALAGALVLASALIVLLVTRQTKRVVARLEAVDHAKAELEDQLFSAAKLASVGEMAAGVAHEVNNPLAIIHEEAGFMKDMLDPELGGKPDMDDFRERLDAIIGATMRARAITSNLLAFARKHDPAPALTEVNALILQVLAMKGQSFKVSNIEVRKELAGDLPKVLVNYNQMEQVLLNLLNNAKDAIKGAGRITLRTRLADGMIAIEVQDTGCGIPPAQLAKIFFPFFTTKGVGKGTGLGLSISYGIVKALGGRIEVKSEVGVGSTFTILLPPAPEPTVARPGPAGG
jgi:two-component system NtrC family sensor kinase